MVKVTVFSHSGSTRDFTPKDAAELRALVTDHRDFGPGSLEEGLVVVGDAHELKEGAQLSWHPAKGKAEDDDQPPPKRIRTERLSEAPDLSAFIEDMKACTPDAAGFITLATTAFPEGEESVPRRALFIRKCYNGMYDVVRDAAVSSGGGVGPATAAASTGQAPTAVASRRITRGSTKATADATDAAKAGPVATTSEQPCNPPKLRKFLVTGTPGCGKSWWLFYLIWRITKEFPDASIVWGRQLSQDAGPSYVLFKSSRAYVSSSVNDFKGETSLGSTWVLCDGLSPPPVRATRIMVSSPSPEAYKGYTKNLDVDRRVMPVPVLEEIHAMHTRIFQELVPRQRLDSLVDLYGCVPRHVLHGPSLQDAREDESEARNAVSRCNIKTLAMVISCRDAWPRESHLLLHILADDRYKFSGVRVASKRITRMLAIHNYKQQREHLRSFLGTLHRDTVWASLAGIMYEFACHIDICRESSYPLRGLGSSVVAARADAVAGATIRRSVGPASWDLHLKGCEHDEFNMRNLKLQVNAANAAASPLYLIPDTPNFKGVDSIRLPNFMFQMTLKKERCFSLAKVQQVLDLLPDCDAYFFIYVVPRSNFERFKASQPDVLSNLPASARAKRLKVLVMQMGSSSPPPTP